MRMLSGGQHKYAMSNDLQGAEVDLHLDCAESIILSSQSEKGYSENCDSEDFSNHELYPAAEVLGKQELSN